MRISDWSSDVCSSDLYRGPGPTRPNRRARPHAGWPDHHRNNPPPRTGNACSVNRRLAHMVFGRAIGADAIQHHGVAFQRKTAVFRDFMLAFFDFRIGEFDDLAAIGADEMVVMIAVVELENRFAAIELTAHQDAGLLELGQHAIDRGQPYFDFLADECTVNVFRALMAMVRLAKHIEDLQAWKCRLETHCFQLVLFVHS